MQFGSGHRREIDSVTQVLGPTLSYANLSEVASLLIYGDLQHARMEVRHLSDGR